MTQAPVADWEIAIILPLGVVANQLRRIETQLRLLNMTALDFARQRENTTHRQLIEVRLEQISETLDSLTGLVSDINADLQPKSARLVRTSIKEGAASLGTDALTDDVRASRDAIGSNYPAIKSRPDQDD